MLILTGAQIPLRISTLVFTYTVPEYGVSVWFIYKQNGHSAKCSNNVPQCDIGHAAQTV